MLLIQFVCDSKLKKDFRVKNVDISSSKNVLILKEKWAKNVVLQLRRKDGFLHENYHLNTKFFNRKGGAKHIKTLFL